MKVNNDIVWAAVCFAAGVGVSFINYLFSRHMLMSKPDKYSLTTVTRQAVQVAFLVAVYFIGEKAGLNYMYLLVGAVLGITLPMLLLTKKLLSLNEKLSEKGDGDDG